MSFDMMRGIAGGVLLLCLISQTNANSAPAITTFLYTVCEDEPIDNVAFTIIASDPEGQPLNYSLSGANAGYFRVEPNTGKVFVSRELDRESADLLGMRATVSDGDNTFTDVINVVLSDANDNKPIFLQSAYDVKVPENTTVGTTLFRVQATDRDMGNAGRIKYSIDEVTPKDGFSLFSIINATGEVRLISPLDYNGLGTFYQLKINASDGGGQCATEEPIFESSITFSTVTVLDVPDLDPLFISLPYMGKVEEHCPLNTTVLKVNAIDQDKGLNYEMKYSIESSTEEGLFKISEDDGVISVASEIDRELIDDVIHLTVKATESVLNIHGENASTTANVQIDIIDINDNGPEFYKCADPEDESSCVKESDFTGEILEHSLGSISLNMTVKDLDKTYKTRLILEGADKDVFSVQPQFTTSTSIVQLLVKQPEKLDYEEKMQMTLELIAIDEDETSFRSTATVMIQIQDSNDNIPEFPQDTYMLNVSEHAPNGTVIAKITAEDPDTMDQGKITYRLLPDSILLYFDVEPLTGVVYVKNETLLDREVRSLYSVTLQARDTSGKAGSTVLEITVTDINDQPPVINRDSYQVFVEEGTNFELKIEATDADDSDTLNSQVEFRIIPSRYSGNFTINPNTGVLRNKGVLDREVLDPQLNGKVELNVTATDKGTPPLSSSVLVIIDVEDVNDNVPEFEAPSYTFSVKEGQKGAYVGSVYAEDLDQTRDFNRISFSIVSGSFASFIIRSTEEERGYSGSITVDPDVELNYESDRKQYLLVVEATDLEQKKAVVQVEVNVLDVNDERPVFQPTAPKTVKENTTISEAIGNFTALDKDGNHSLVYELESMECRCKGEMTPCNSFILDPSGEVRVNPEHLMDYEECDQAVITAQVVDEFTEKGENNSVSAGVMVINMEDINDNAPEFIHSDAVFVVVSESASKGTSVAGVTATDRDTGPNGEITFAVTTVQFKHSNNEIVNMRNLFVAVTTLQKDIYIGLIQTLESLDMTLKGKYLVTVTATDDGGLSSSTVLEIFTVDETYKVELEFTSTEAEVEADLDEIIRALTAATRAAVQIVAIRPDTSADSRASGNTIIEAYFVFSNGTALTSTEVEKSLSDPAHYVTLGQLGLANIGKASIIEPDTDPVMYILLGMVAGLVIVLGVLVTSLMCTRRSFKRKLKAAKAMNSASMVTSENQKSGPVMPGTNKYTMEGANPVLNLNIDTAMALDLDGESSDVDKVSLNSLDCNDYMIIPEKGTKSSMYMIQEEEDNGPPEYTEPLGEALAKRGQKKGSAMGVTNPVFSTTDL